MDTLILLAILAGIVWLVINYWPIILGLIVIGGLIYAVVNYEPPPNPKKEIRFPI